MKRIRNNISAQSCWIISVLFIITLVQSANSQNIETFLRPYADDIVRSAAFEFVDKENDEKFSSTENMPINGNLKVESHYLRWHYTSALVFEGLFALGAELGDKDYSNFVMKYFQFVFDNQDYLERISAEGHSIEGLERFGRFRGLWDNGAQAAALINVYENDPDPGYLEFLEQTAEFFFQYDLDPKNNSRKRNVDQIYTQGVFMARMGKLSGDSRYFDYCLEKVLQMDSMFYDPLTGLYNQIYYPELKITNNIKWLRGMGWSAMALVNILDCMPAEHPGYEKVLKVYRKQIAGICAYQTKSGLWRHLVNRTDSFEETSGSVYIVYAIARGINDGLLDPVYKDVVVAGWQGIVSKRQENGEIAGSTPGVSSSTSPAYYLNNETENNGDHLFGPLFLAGAEMIKLQKK